MYNWPTSTTGNHEYYNNRLKPFLKIAKKSGIRVLRNEWLTIGAGKGEIQIAGINDPTAGAFGYPRPDIKTALKVVDPQKPLILLSHQPGFFPEAVSQGVDLQLSAPPMPDRFLQWTLSPTWPTLTLTVFTGKGIHIYLLHLRDRYLGSTHASFLQKRLYQDHLETTRHYFGSIVITTGFL